MTHEWILNAKQFSETYSTSEDSAEYITSSFIGRQNAVSNHIGNGSGMIRNNFQCNIALCTLSIGNTGESRCFFNNREEQVCFEIVFLVLQYGCKTFQTCTGINVFLCQRKIGAILLTVILAEYQVPDFKETITVSAHLIFRVCSEFFSLIEENFRIRAARAFTDFPEIIGKRINMIFRQSDHRMPVIISFLIIRIDCNIQAGAVEFDYFSKEFPCPGNSFLLEIIAKGEVSQHFEKCMVSCSISYIFDITSADALLACCDSMSRRFNLACEKRF